MKRKTKSLDCLYFETGHVQWTGLSRSKSLTNLHLNVNVCWFSINNKLTRSASASSISDRVNENVNKSPPRMNSSRLVDNKTRAAEDHNLPKCISDDLFNILMRCEKIRLRTFENWPLDFITPSELSKAGFYYTLVGDQVCCFECKVVLFNWEVDDRAIVEHCKNNPKCKLINGYDVGNVPIDRTPLELLNERVDLRVFRPVQQTEDVIFEFNDLDDDDEDLEQLNTNALQFSPRTSRRSPTTPLAPFEEQIFEQMKSEAKRLKSFDTWPTELVDKVKPVDLAQCGYFYTAIYDKVVCAFCKTPAWDWAATDVPIKEHYKHNSDCPLLNDVECGNQPIVEISFKELLMQYADIAPNYSSSYSDDEVSFLQMNRTNQSVSPLPPANLNQPTFDKVILKHQPVNKFYTFEQRMETFKNWPYKFPKKDRIAEAGFYYLGK